jgi:MFS transporter, DHA3 family, macrolide efflux protein
VVLSPFAGVFVDRWDRRLTMLFADLAAGAATLALAALYLTDALVLWHIYLLVGVGAVGNAFQAPAWMASVPLLVPKRHLGRANGMVQTSDAVSLVAAPAIAGALLAAFGLGAVLLADVLSFLVAVGTLAVVRFPPVPDAGSKERVTVLEDARRGWRYLRERSGLVWLLGIYAGVNFSLAFTNVLLIPLVVSFTNEAAAGGVLSIAGVGMLVGSVAVGAAGIPRRKMAGLLGGIGFAGIMVMVEGVRPSVLLISVGAFLLMLSVPVVNAISQVIWQTKVAPAVQGRVFALRRTISQAISPIAILAAGPLADGVFEPLLAPDGGLAGSVGRVIGTGEGRGIGFMAILSGVGVVLLAVAGWLNPRVRHLDEELPDLLPEEEEEEAAGNPLVGDGVVADMDPIAEFRQRKDEFFATSHHSPLPHDLRHGFGGLRYYPPDPDLAFEVPVEPGDGSAITVATSDGAEREYRRAGTITVPIDGEEVTLTLYETPGDEGYFLPFRDATSGKETYGAGRYLDLAPPHDGTIRVDFNLAYNPFCAYSESYSCALPPVENWLQVPIRAGELVFERPGD